MRTTPLLNALRIDKIQLRFDINKLKFFLRLCRNFVTKEIVLYQLNQAQINLGRLEQGKWAIHIVEVLQVIKRVDPEKYIELTDSLNCTQLFDPETTISNQQAATPFQRLNLDDLQQYVLLLIQLLEKQKQKQYKDGVSDSIRFLLDGNNKQSYTVLKQLLKTYEKTQ